LEALPRPQDTEPKQQQKTDLKHKESDRPDRNHGGLEISFPDLVANPHPILEQLADFLGDAFTLGPKVEACIKPALHRNRKPRPPVSCSSSAEP
jgi:hypothetical protein